MTIKADKKYAEKLYKLYLPEVYKLIGKNTTYLNELFILCKKLFGNKFAGVFPSDKIPILTDETPYCILNLDKTGEPGSHWIAIAKKKDPSNETIVYDSFGRTHEKIIPTLKKSGNGKIVNTGKDAEQKIAQMDCGARCIAFLLVCNNHGERFAMYI